MAKSWNEVVALPAYQALTPEKQERLRNAYFEEVLAPELDYTELATAREVFDAETAPPAPPQPNSSLLGDVVDLAQKGAYDAAGGVLDLAGLDSGAEWLYDQGQAQEATLTPETRAARAQPLFDDQGDYYLGEGFTNPRAWLAAGAETLGGMALPIPGGALAKAALRPLLGLGRAATVAKEALVAGGLTERAATAAARQAAPDWRDTAAMVAGYGGMEGAVSGGLSEREVRERALAMPWEQVQQDPAYWQAVQAENGDLEAAKVRWAEDLGKSAGLKVALPTALLGAGAGHYYDKLIGGGGTGSRLRNIGQGATTEALEEVPQAAVETLAQNQTLQQADPNLGLTDGLVANMLTGGALGGLAGGTIAGVMPKGRRPEGETDPGPVPPGTDPMTGETLPPVVDPTTDGTLPPVAPGTGPGMVPPGGPAAGLPGGVPPVTGTGTGPGAGMPGVPGSPLGGMPPPGQGGRPPAPRVEAVGPLSRAVNRGADAQELGLGSVVPAPTVDPADQARADQMAAQEQQRQEEEQLLAQHRAEQAALKTQREAIKTAQVAQQAGLGVSPGQGTQAAAVPAVEPVRGDPTGPRPQEDVWSDTPDLTEPVEKEDGTWITTRRPSKDGRWDLYEDISPDGESVNQEVWPRQQPAPAPTGAAETPRSITATQEQPDADRLQGQGRQAPDAKTPPAEVGAAVSQGRPMDLAAAGLPSPEAGLGTTAPGQGSPGLRRKMGGLAALGLPGADAGLGTTVAGEGAPELKGKKRVVAETPTPPATVTPAEPTVAPDAMAPAQPETPTAAALARLQAHYAGMAALDSNAQQIAGRAKQGRELRAELAGRGYAVSEQNEDEGKVFAVTVGPYRVFARQYRNLGKRSALTLIDTRSGAVEQVEEPMLEGAHGLAALDLGIERAEALWTGRNPPAAVSAKPPADEPNPSEIPTSSAGIPTGAGVSAPAANALVSVVDIYGNSYRVKQRELDNPALTLLPIYDKAGNFPGKKLHRENIAPDPQQVPRYRTLEALRQGRYRMRQTVRSDAQEGKLLGNGYRPVTAEADGTFRVDEFEGVWAKPANREWGPELREAEAAPGAAVSATPAAVPEAEQKTEAVAQQADQEDSAAAPVAEPQPADQPPLAEPSGAAPSPAWGAANTLVSQERMAELRKRAKAKLAQLNSGIDPEMLAIMTEMAAFHLEAGARRFGDFARTMAADLGVELTQLRPFLRSAYNGARDMMEDHGLDVAGIDSPETVRTELAKLFVPTTLEPKPTTEETADDQPGTGEADQGGERQGGGGNLGAGRPDPNQDDRQLARDPAQDGGGPGAAGYPGGVRPSAAGTPGGDGGPLPGGGDGLAGQPGAGQPGLADQRTGNGRRPGGRRGTPDGDGGAGLSTPEGEAGGGALAPEPTHADDLAARAENFHADDPLRIYGGTPKVRFRKNRRAIELYRELEETGRAPTREEQEELAGYTGFGSFGQELFKGTWDRADIKEGWEAENEWMRNFLGESEWKSAQASIINAHYTDPPTVQAMWAAIEKLGFKGGRVLEPSAGVGNFFALMPKPLQQASKLTGIELDELTAGILKQLYPEANIQQKGYQDSQTPDNFYDLVIGNWPFASTGPADRRYNALSPSLHDYFFLKALDQVRPGGLVVGITSRYTLDGKASGVRQALARKADLVAAIRLPSGAFEDYAGTKVVTDILILQKRAEENTQPGEVPWTQTQTQTFPGGNEAAINRYYLEHPEQVLGTLAWGSGTTYGRAGVIVERPENLAERLTGLTANLPADLYQPASNVKPLRYLTNNSQERQFAVTVGPDGGLYQIQGERMAALEDIISYRVKDAKKTAAREAQLRALVGLRQAYGTLIDGERDGAAGVEDLRATLKGQYDAFVAAHGPVRKSVGMAILKRLEDPFYPSLMALERERDGVITPMPILERSVMRRPARLDNPSIRDAYVLARNQGLVLDMDAVATLAKVTPEAAAKELIEAGAVFRTPAGSYEPADVYLGGNVRRKLREAQAAAEQGEDMAHNIAELEKVIPPDVPYFNVEARLGAQWVAPRFYRDFVAQELLGNPELAEGLELEWRINRWVVRPEDAARNLPAAVRWRTIEARNAEGEIVDREMIPFRQLVETAFNNGTMRFTYKDEDGNTVVREALSAAANEKAGAIREAFEEWIWKEPERKVALERDYNEVMNAIANPRFDGSFLAFEGMALQRGDNDFNLRSHQSNAIWRGLVQGAGLYAHEVGTGKTYTLAGIAVESRRFGLAKKPLILAHNANSASVAAEIQEMYPGAKVLYVNNLQPKRVKETLAQIRNDDWDAVVMPHSLLDRLTLSEATLREVAAEEIASLEAAFWDALREAEAEDASAAGYGQSADTLDMDDPESVKKIRNATAKELANARLKILERIRRQAQEASRADAVTFEDLGVDMLMVDEAHLFKKPPMATRMKMRGLQKQLSNRSVALKFLTDYIKNQNGGRGVHLFTGTPITNTLAEIFHMQRYVMHGEMKRDGIGDWDSWFNTFATGVSDVEFTAAGDYQPVTKLAGFINVAELRRMMSPYMDVVFADDMPEFTPRQTPGGKTLASADLTEQERDYLLNGREENPVGRPYRKVVMDVAEMSPEQQAILAYLQDMAAGWRAASGKTRRDWMLEGDPHSPIMIEGAAARAGMDARMEDLSLPDYPANKINRAVRNIMRHYQDEPLAGQVVFMDKGYSDTRTVRGERVPGLNLAKELREKLIAAGIPAGEIAIVAGGVTPEQKKAVADAVNSGKVRVVIGQTETLGTGVNMQQRLRAMHHLDAPWMPGELEQRNGRGWRQGNSWNTVMEYRYITERIDGKRWQVLAVKDRFIKAFLKANADTRVIEGDAVSDEEGGYAETLSEAVGDPRLLQRQKLRADLEKLNRRERTHTQGMVEAREKLARNKRSIPKKTAEIATYRGDAALFAEAEAEAGRAQQADYRARVNTYVQSLGLDLTAAQRASLVADGWQAKQPDKELAKRVRAAVLRAEEEGRARPTEPTTQPFAGHLLNDRLTTREEMTTALTSLWQRMPQDQAGWVPVGDIFGFRLEARRSGRGDGELRLVSGTDDQHDYWLYSRSGASIVNEYLRGFKKQADKLQREIVALQRDQDKLAELAKQPFARAEELARKQARLAEIESDMALNPVPAPAWLRHGAPLDSQAFWKGKPVVVEGHQWADDGYFVHLLDGEKARRVPYLEVQDANGAAVYEPHEFTAPVVREAEAENPAPGGQGPARRNAGEVVDIEGADEAGPVFSKRALPKTLEVDGRQRPTTNSEGRPIHLTEEGVRNFWRWLGDSKAVDAQGRPLVVYHGTRADFSAFDRDKLDFTLRGIGFDTTTDQRYASFFAADEGGNVMPLYVRVTSPLKIADVPAWHRMVNERFGRYGKEKMIAWMRQEGYDGVEWPTKEGVRHFVPLDPEQLKSAIGNRGTFDSLNQDVRFAKTSTPGAGGSVTAITQAMRRLMRPWANAPRPVVFQGMNDPQVDAEVRQAYAEESARRKAKDPKAKSDLVEGFYFRGKVYINAEAVRNVADLERVLRHETLGHAGLRGLFGGPELDALLDRMARARRGEVAAMATARGLEMTDQTQRRQAAEEVLAELAQTRPEIGWVRELLALIKAKLREWGVLDADKLSDAEMLREYVIPARNFIERGRMAEGRMTGAAVPAFAKGLQAGMPETLEVDGQQRPTTNSEGRPIHPTEEGVRNFWKWFGDSKVVDGQGRPLVVYHGTPNEFTVFESRPGRNFLFGESDEVQRHGIFVTPNAVFAEEFSFDERRNSKQPMALFANMQKPLDLREGIDGQDEMALRNAGFTQEIPWAYTDYWQLFDDDVGEEFVSAARSAGFDGALLSEVNDSGREVPVFVMFGNRHQLKDARENTGAFDSSNPDIRFSLARDADAGGSPLGGGKAFLDSVQQWLGDSWQGRVASENYSVLGALTLRQLAEVGAKWLPGIQLYDRLRTTMETRRNVMMEEAGRLGDGVDSWARKHPEEARAVFELENETTLAQVDPSDYQVLMIPLKLGPGPEMLRNWAATEENVKELRKRARAWRRSKQVRERELAAYYSAAADKLNLALRAERRRQAALPELARKWAALSSGQQHLGADGAPFATEQAARAALTARRWPKGVVTVVEAVPGGWAIQELGGQQVYTRMRDLYKKRSDEMREALIKRIEGLQGLDEESKRALAARIRAEFENPMDEKGNPRIGPYFPLQRFGRFYVAAQRLPTGEARTWGQVNGEPFTSEASARSALNKRPDLHGVSAKVVPLEDGTGFVLEERAEEGFWLAESPREQRQTAAALEAEGWVIQRQGLTAVVNQDLEGVSEGFVAEAVKKLQDKGAKDEADMLYQMYLTTLSQMSIRKHFKHRKGTAGYSADQLRAFGWNMTRLAHQVSKLEHLPDMERALLDIQEEVKQQQRDDRTFNATRANAMLKEVKLRHDWVANPDNAPWTNALSALGFVFYLGVSPAAALVNLSQVPIVGLPVLAARYGSWGAAAKGLTTAFVDVARGFNPAVLKGFITGRPLPSDAANLTEEERQAFAEWDKTGARDRTQAHNLAGIGDADNWLNGPTFNRVMGAVSSLFHAAEVVNRDATLLAAYRLGRAKGLEHDTAVMQAEAATWEAHFDYSNANRARMMQGNVAKVLLMFKNYSQHVLYFLGRNLFLSVKGESAEVKREARTKFSGMVGMTALFAGAAGLPVGGFFVMANLLQGMFGDDDEPWDAEIEFRNWLAATFPEGVSDVLDRGAVNTLTGLDFSSRVSIGDLIWRAPDRDLDGAGMFQHVVEQMLGPVGGLAARPFTMYDELREGRWVRAAEAASPKFLRDLVQSGRFAEEGVLTRKGAEILAPGELSSFELFAKAMGMNPDDLAVRYQQNSAIKLYEQRITDRRRVLVAAAAMAIMAKDTQGQAAAREKIAAFNRVHPEIKISVETLKRSVRAREMMRERAKGGIAINPKLDYLREQAGGFGEQPTEDEEEEG
jgi:N12 class adenine-specific DNA methylase